MSNNTQLSPFSKISFPLNVYAQALLLEEGKAEYLHYGLFENEESTLHDAQNHSTNLILKQLPPPPCKILEVGTGLGTTLQLLTTMGYQVQGITPDLVQINYIQTKWGDSVAVSCQRFEDFSAEANSFDIVLLQESGQYIDPINIFNQALECLIDSGSLIILDEFSLVQQEGKQTSLHDLNDILALAKRFNFNLQEKLDLSKLATPTLDYLLSVTQKHRSQLISDLELSPEQLELLDYSNRDYKQNYTQGYYGYYLLNFKKNNMPKWRLKPFNNQHFAAIQQLFKQSFEQSISQPLWEWKYRSAQAQELCTWKGNTLIAHYGGMPRNILFFGKKHMAVQIGDVMVNPSHRGALRRTGPFFMMAATFMERYTGFGKPFVISFGFPNDRAMKVAAHLNLYDSLGHMEQLSWLPIYKRPKLLTTLRVIDQNSIINFEHAINILWQHMADDLKKAMIGVRDYNYIIDRYVNHPENTYQILIVKSRFSRKIHSLIVIQIIGEYCHIIDVITPIKNISLLIQYTQRFAQTNRCTRIICQISNAFSRYFETTDSHREALNIQIASDIWSKGPDVSILRNKFWLMSGDMDFR